MPVIVPASPLVYPFTRPAPSFGHIEFKLNGFPFIKAAINQIAAQTLAQMTVGI